MQPATQRKVRLPYPYKGFYLTRSHGRLYGIPPFLDPNEVELFIPGSSRTLPADFTEVIFRPRYGAAAPHGGHMVAIQ